MCGNNVRISALGEAAPNHNRGQIGYFAPPLRAPTPGWRDNVARTGRLIVAAAGLALLAFLAGFVVFAGSVTHDAPRTVEHADGIVVLTGGPFRLSAAARLLAAGLGSRLLISGVNHMPTSTTERVPKPARTLAASGAICSSFLPPYPNRIISVLYDGR